MNRKKKINEKLKAFQKRKNAKLHTSNKPKYISKAERARIAAEAELENASVPAITAEMPESDKSAS